MSKTLYVGNIPHASTDAEIEAAFAVHGSVVSVNIIKDRETGRSRGFAFVEMEDDSAEAAKQAMDGADLGGRSIKVNDAKPRQPRGD